METTIGARIRQLREAKQLSVADFAKAAGVKPSAVYGLESDANKPSLETVATLRLSFPGLNTEWLQFGDGEMFSRPLTPAPQLLPAPGKAEEPAAPSDAVTKLLDHITELGQRHAETMKQAKKEYRHQLDEQARLFQYAIDLIASARDAALRRVQELEHQNVFLEQRLGLRPAPMDVPAEPARIEVKGLKNYQAVDPQGVEMVAVRGGTDFSRPHSPVLTLWAEAPSDALAA